MPSPLSVKKNNYIKNPKRSDIPTPDYVAEFIARLFEDVDISGVYDPCCGNNALLLPFHRRGCWTKGVDIKNEPKVDFLKLKDFSSPVKWDLVICNPPFNLGVGKKLGSELFLEHILKIFGNEVRIVLFVPMGFRLNQRKTSKRWKWLRDNCPPISSILSLPLDVFDGVEFHNEVLFFNCPELKPHYFLREVK